MTLLEIIVWALSLPPIALTLLPYFRTTKWWVRVWDYPRLQLAAWLVGAGAAQLLFLAAGGSSLLLLVATAAALVWQLWWIFPYTPLHRRQVPGAPGGAARDEISILVANVLQDNRDAPAFLRCVETVDPDLLFAVETDRWWDAQLEPLAARYPFCLRHPLENTYGLHLFSRLELVDAEVRERVADDIPSIFARVRLRSGALVNLHCVHPEPPQIGNDVGERDVELLLVAQDAAADRRPTIVCGDLNDVAWSFTTRRFQRLSGLRDPRVGRGLFATFHAGYWFARWPLDHVFHDPSFRVRRIRVLGPIGSDHFPINVILVHEEAAALRS
jgi:endonuclease/exonuclease/phosphatase (EEP) superfamily protein YafD